MSSRINSPRLSEGILFQKRLQPLMEMVFELNLSRRKKKIYRKIKSGQRNRIREREIGMNQK